MVELSSGTYRVMGSAKKPFMRSGHGLLGLMVCTQDGSKVLCHECGLVFEALSRHLRGRKHRLSPNEYRERHSLLYGQSLSSPRHQMACAARCHEMRQLGLLKNGPPFGGGEQLAKTVLARRRSAAGRNSWQFRNKHDTCEAQLRARFLRIARQDGIRPADVKSSTDAWFGQAVITHYGTWNLGKERLLKICIDELPPASRRGYWTRERIVQAIQDWQGRYGRTPIGREFRARNGLPTNLAVAKIFGGFRPMFQSLGIRRFTGRPQGGARRIEVIPERERTELPKA